MVAASLLISFSGCSSSDEADSEASTAPVRGPQLLCDQLVEAVEAGEGLDQSWDAQPLLATASSMDEPELANSVDTFANSVNQLLTGEGERFPPLVYQSSVDFLGWWSASECGTSFTGTRQYDSGVNPSGMTIAAPIPLPRALSNDEQLIASPTVALYANADRSCFALGRYVEANYNDYLRPDSAASESQAAQEASSRATCLETDTQSGEPLWTASYEGWLIRIGPSGTVDGGDETQPLTDELDLTVSRE